MKKKLTITATILSFFICACPFFSGCALGGVTESSDASTNTDNSADSKGSQDVSPSNSDSGNNQTLHYTVNVYDIDDELLASKKLTATPNDTFWNQLTAEFEVNYTASDYGPYLSSIEGQMTDSNWYVSVYENNQASTVGVSQLHIDEGDVFDFRMECWNTEESGYGSMDAYDVLVDKALYHYAKTYMQQLLAQDRTYTGGNFWTYMAVYMMRANGYDTSAFHFDCVTDELRQSVTDAQMSTLSGINFGKYFYTARALSLNTDSFNSVYSDFIKDYVDETYSEYSMPFIMSPAKSLSLTSDRLQRLIDTDYMAGTSWGTDGLAWQITSLQLWNKYTPDVLTRLPVADQGNGTSTALLLLPYAALNVSPRRKNADLIQILFDGYYDEESKLLKWKKSDADVQSSTCQIYASLMAYKAFRDTGKAVNIFA